jgi:hypothetical protein
MAEAVAGRGDLPMDFYYTRSYLLLQKLRSARTDLKIGDFASITHS